MLKRTLFSSDNTKHENNFQNFKFKLSTYQVSLSVICAGMSGVCWTWSMLTQGWHVFEMVGQDVMTILAARIEWWTCDQKVLAEAAGEFSSPGSTFWADLFWNPFHPRVTTVACKRSGSLFQKCRWQVTAKHMHPTLCGLEFKETHMSSPTLGKNLRKKKHPVLNIKEMLLCHSYWRKAIGLQHPVNIHDGYYRAKSQGINRKSRVPREKTITISQMQLPQ